MDKTLNIVSVNNDRVKQWSRLLEKKGRDQQGKFLVEGTHLVIEAIRSGASIETIVYAEFRGVPQEIREAISAGDPAAGHTYDWVSVSEEVLAKCTDAQTPQGIFAVVNKRSDTLDVLWGCSSDGGGLNNDAEGEVEGANIIKRTDHASLVVVVDGVQDPGNLGTIIRSADAVGATAVVLGRGTVDLYNPKTVRSTMGSLFHLPIIEADLEPLLQEAHKRGIQLVNTSLQAKQSCYEVDFSLHTWFVVGNEGRGVSDSVASIVNTHVIIPMAGGAESLNVAMAATVLLFEASRQRLL
jgi:TrmH family RNA methyltransferase